MDPDLVGLPRLPGRNERTLIGYKSESRLTNPSRERVVTCDEVFEPANSA